MVKLMTEQKAMEARKKADETLEDLQREIQKAKLSILAAENQLKLGAIPHSAISDLEERARSMGKAAITAENYEQMGRFLSDLRCIA